MQDEVAARQGVEHPLRQFIEELTDVGVCHHADDHAYPRYAALAA